MKFQSASPTEIRVGVDGYVLFKVAHNGSGRKVSLAAAGGRYIAVVPKSWRRDLKLCGPAPAADEPTSVPDYRAHHFTVRSDDRKPIAFHTREGDAVSVSDGTTGFQLIGKTCPDDSDRGPLFVGAIPRLSVDNPVIWTQLDIVVLGEEGPGRGKWRTDFLPHPDDCGLLLPQELAERRSGWFFIRLYDKQNQLLDSFDFRFASSLKGIRFPNPFPMLPPAGGHQPVEITVEHGEGARLVPCDHTTGRTCRVEEDAQTRIIVPPDQEFDVSGWTLRQDGGGPLELMFKLPRIRWALGTRQEPTEWTDRPLQLSLDDCDVLSERRLWIYWPTGNDEPRKIDIGFSHGSWRTIDVRRGERCGSLELLKFCNAPELQKCGHVQMCAWLLSGEGAAVVAELHTVLACTLCDFVCDDRDAMFGHVTAKHEASYFRQLTYEELQKSMPERSLPAFIYRCSYCGFIAEAGDGKAPHKRILDHLKLECIRNTQPRGDRGIQYLPISKIEEVRRLTRFTDLPDITVCTICTEELQPGTPDQRHEHLSRCHEKRLYTRR